MYRPSNERGETEHTPEPWGAQSRLQARNRELALLNELVFATSRTLVTADIVAEVQTVLFERLGIPGGAIFLLDRMEPVLRLEASWNMPAPFRRRFRSCPTEEPWVHPVTQKQRSVLMADLPNAPAFAGTDIIAGRPEWRLALSLPLLNQRGIEGIVCLFGRHAEGFNPEQIRFLETLAGETGILLKNSRLVEQPPPAAPPGATRLRCARAGEAPDFAGAAR